jgi:hypothetical protein
MNGAKYYLNANVFSNCTGSVHAIMGTQVKVLSPMEDHISVVTVEDEDGNRFPVSVKKLSPDPVIVDEPEPIMFVLETINKHKESFLYH